MPGNDVIFNIRERGGRQAAASTDRVGRGFTSLGRRARRSGSDVVFFNRASVSATGHLRLLGGAALYGGAALGGVLALGLKRTVDEYEDARKVGTSTNAVIRSTGGVANVTARNIDALSSSLSRKAGIDDEEIARGANMLLTFRAIRNEVGANNDIFNQATKAAVDMAAGMTAMGKSMSVTSAATLLGKALNDPVRGASALGRTGAIDKAAVERIKKMSEAGVGLRKLQKFVLSEVNAQFGGQAAATATPLGKLKVGVENVEEAIGRGLSPATDAIAVKLGKLADNAAPQFDKLGRKLEVIFDRKDLDFNQKLGLTSSALSHTMRPYGKAFKREIRKLHLGEKLGDAIEFAIPKIADAAAQAAPKAATAFLNGWLHAGIWGKLITLGLLERKLGLFTTLGGLASGRFTTSFVAGQTAQRGTYTALGTRLGGFMGPAMAVAAAGYLALELQKQFGGAFSDILGLPTDSKIAVDTNPKVMGVRAWNRYLQKHPDVRGNWMRNASPAMRDAHERYLDLSTGALKAPRGTSTQLERYLRQAGDPMFAPRTPTQARAMHVNVYIDGKNVVHRLVVDHGKQLRKGVRRADADAEARR